MKNELVFLEMALIQFVLKKLISKNFKIMTCPEIVKNELINGCGFNPRDKNKSQIYNLDDDCSLIGTSEISLMGLHANEIINKKELPLKYCAVSHCYRREAGRGNISKGLYRLHQFTKVEMFGFTENKLSLSESLQLEMIEIQKEIFSELGLNYKVLEMSTEELGNSAYRKFDIEAYFPSLNGFGEISSCSNCLDYQSKRLLAQYFDSTSDSEADNNKLKNKSALKKSFMHTINGTAIAIPRIIMAILEIYQNEKYEIEIPKCLQPYMCNISKIPTINTNI